MKTNTAPHRLLAAMVGTLAFSFLQTPADACTHALYVA